MIVAFGLLLLWGTLVGLDLASVAQTMIARPLVAGAVAGVVLGDPLAGGTVGMVLELFALDVLPVGAARYPDYGIGAVAGAATAAGSPGMVGIGVAVSTGLIVAYLGEIGIVAIRKINTVDLRRHRDGLDAGRLRTVRGLHLRGLIRDLARSALLTVVGLGLAVATSRWAPGTIESTLLMTLVLVGAGLGAATAGILKAVEREAVVRWFGLGLLLGCLYVVVTR